ncbi:hypothetical protein evm_009489 [Chilo suppressalis]|nr:hypothetical protein evm_009489 [Chilo suppressalis]
MADKAVHFNTGYNLYDIETIAKWLSCNGEAWGMGPTVVFASAAALFLYNELEATVFVPGDQLHVSVLEKTLISTMVLGMLALMVHLWVCSMRFFQYYLDTLIKDSPNMLLEMTTAGLLGAEVMPLSTLTRFLRQQQPQIHITICWFLSLCYADYVRKHYCQRFNMPYLEQWQSELHARAARGVHQTMEKVNSFVGCVHRRLRGYGPPGHRTTDTHTVIARYRSARRRWRSAGPPVCSDSSATVTSAAAAAAASAAARRQPKSCACDSSVSRAKQLLMQLRNSEPLSQQQDVRVAVHRTPASLVLSAEMPRRQRSLDDFPWRKMAELHFD